MKIFKILALATLTIAATSCSSDDDAGTQASTASIDGAYVLSSMVSTPAVDLNGDGTSNSDLLMESNCFDSMAISLNSNGTFSSNVSTLEFDSMGNISNCASRTDSGTWTFSDPTLTLTVNIPGGSATENRQVTTTVVGGIITEFSFDISETEADQYVNDPGNTSGSNITGLTLGFSRI